jgi:hypothetical protein
VLRAVSRSSIRLLSAKLDISGIWPSCLSADSLVRNICLTLRASHWPPKPPRFHSVNWSAAKSDVPAAKHTLLVSFNRLSLPSNDTSSASSIYEVRTPQKSPASDVRGSLGNFIITTQNPLFCLQVTERLIYLLVNRFQVDVAIVAPQICLSEKVNLIREEEKCGASCRPPDAIRARGSAEAEPSAT